MSEGERMTISPKKKKVSNKVDGKLRKASQAKASEAKTLYKLKKGGSRVNEAGKYANPTMSKSVVNKRKAVDAGGNPGQWSARKAQMLAKQYKAKGGRYT